MKIVLDTNFLLLPVQRKLDIFEELHQSIMEPYDLYVLDATLDELRKIRGKDRPAARVALELIQAKHLNIIGNLREKTVDDELVLLSREGYRVATLDRELRKRIGAAAVVLRSRKRIQV
jgi:uncharacterized protein